MKCSSLLTVDFIRMMKSHSIFMKLIDMASDNIIVLFMPTNGLAIYCPKVE